MSAAPIGQRPVCSRADCRLSATWRVEWRNPKIHDADRVKVWLACDEHRDFLHEYLASRQFPVAVVAMPPDDPADVG